MATEEPRAAHREAADRQAPHGQRDGEPVRVLHTLRNLRIDGVVKVVMRNVQHLDASHFRHIVCSMYPDEGQLREFHELGIRPLMVEHRGPRDVPRSIARLVRLMREERIEVVHANRTLDMMLAGAAARMLGIPMVSSLHWLGRPEDHPEDDAPMLLQHAEKRGTVLLNRLLARRIVAVSSAVSRSFSTLPGFPSSRVEVVYPGIALDDSSPDAKTSAARTARLEALRSSLSLLESHPVLLNVGRLHPVKGQRSLIPMMHRVLQRLPSAHLLIAGDGELRGELERLVSDSGLGNSITLLGARSDVDDLMSLCDAVVLSSESEAAPLPVFEAMRASRPIVATAVGGVPEMVVEGETGFVVNRDDPDALAAGVLRIFESAGLAQRMGMAARRLAEERFDIRHSVRQLEALYRRLARGE